MELNLSRLYGRRATSIAHTSALAFFFAAASQSSFAAEKLLVIEMEGAVLANGSREDWRFKEIERSARSSIVDVEVGFGRTSRFAFIRSGFCSLMRLRGERFYTLELISGNSFRYKVTYQENATKRELEGQGGAKVFSEFDCPASQAGNR